MEKQKYLKTILLILGSCSLITGMELAQAHPAVGAIQNSNKEMIRKMRDLLKSSKAVSDHIEKAIDEIEHLEKQNRHLKNPSLSYLPSQVTSRGNQIGQKLDLLSTYVKHLKNKISNLETNNAAIQTALNDLKEQNRLLRAEAENRINSRTAQQRRRGPLAPRRTVMEKQCDEGGYCVDVEVPVLDLKDLLPNPKEKKAAAPSSWVKKGGYFAPKETVWEEQCDESGCVKVEVPVLRLR